MSGSVLIRSDWIEFVRSLFVQFEWSGHHFVGQIPKPEGQPEGTVYRAKDLRRFDYVERREHARVAL
eukprot:9725520-Lingulodinium_polyedra.AAC.1